MAFTKSPPDDARMKELEASLLSGGGQLERLLVGLVRGDDDMAQDASKRPPTSDRKNSRQIATLQLEVERLRDEVEHLRFEKASAEAKAGRVIEVKPRETPEPNDGEREAREEVRRLQDEVRKLERQMSSSDNAREATERKAVEAVRELDDANRRAEDLEQQLSELRRQMSGASKQLMGTKAELQQAWKIT